jgi:Skp family chaperone for outer membrane proteins
MKTIAFAAMIGLSLFTTTAAFASPASRDDRRWQAGSVSLY